MIRLSKSIVGKQEAQAVSTVINNIGYLGMGSTVKEFETKIESYVGGASGSCCCVNTGTSALHLAIQAITQPGDHVLVPSLTYVATYQAITAAGCIPVSCDVDYETFLLDFNDVKERITSRCKAIVYVHFASNPGNLDDLYNFGKKHNLRIIEDAAHSFGCLYKQKKIGSFGDIICFSFDGIKNITSGEGGALITQDKNVLNFANDARLLGVTKDTEKRYSGERSWDFDVIHQGYRFHMSNIFAAVGLVQLSRFENEFALKRKMLKTKYIECLSGVKEVVFQKTDIECDIVPHILPIKILNNNRNRIFDILTENNIGVGIHYKPNHLLTYFKSNYDLPVTEKIYSEIISLPLHPEISEDDVINVSNLIKSNL